jgi:hypothetical protein
LLPPTTASHVQLPSLMIPMSLARYNAALDNATVDDNAAVVDNAAVSVSSSWRQIRRIDCSLGRFSCFFASTGSISFVLSMIELY